VPTDPNRVKDLFLAASALLAPLRPAYLGEVCGEDGQLRAAVERLLAAHDAPDGRIEPLPASPGLAATGSIAQDTRTSAGDDAPRDETADHAPRPDAGTVIAGKYKLIEEIGEGGMGSVWMAQQTEPVRRTVAVKLIKAGMDSRAVLARFEAERQAIALMDHPNIAKVLDAGATPNGLPFFVMEMVKGVPITKFCDELKLDPRQRLELFVPVCLAIQHAHQKGIIHRDIKPSNVLIALYDEKAVPKVIDFGVAKAAGQPLTDKTLATGFGAVVGTPEYMSPEQASFNNQDIDTRSDVYALGVLLYELLAGSPPFSRTDLARAGLLEILRVVREVEPQRPSTKLSTADALPSLSASRGTEPKKLTRLLRGELDWIVMKALEKDRNRRYETANGFAADVQRYLLGEPVQAVPPSTGYRLKKFYRRNRGPVLAAGLLFVVLLLGIVGTTYGLVRADRSAGREAARSAQLERSNDVLKSVLKTFDPHDEEQAVGPLRVQFAQRLRKAVAALDGDALGDPLTVARLQYTLGVSLLGLGYAEDAIQVLDKARATFDRELGPDSEESMHAVVYLGDAHSELDDPDTASRLHKEVLDRRIRVLGPDNPDTLVSVSDFAVALIEAHRPREAVPMLQEALAKHTAARGSDHTFTLLLATNLAHALAAVGRGDEALRLAEQSLERARVACGPSHLRTIRAAAAVGGILGGQGRADLAIPMLEENLARARAEHGADHPFTMHCTQTLIVVLLIGEQHDRAYTLSEEVVKLMAERYGSDHPKTLAAKALLARGHRFCRRLEKSNEVAMEALTTAEKRLGPDHDTTLALVNELSLSHLALKDTDRGVALAERYLAGLRKRRLDPDDAAIHTALNNLGEAYRQAGKPERALPLLEEAVAGSTRRWGASAPATLNATSNLAFVLVELHRSAEAVQLLERTTKGFAPRDGQKPSAEYSGGLLKLARVYGELQQFVKAAATFEQAVAALAAVNGAESVTTLVATKELADMQLCLKQYASAIKVLERTVPLFEKVCGPSDTQTLSALELLEAAYAATGQVDKLADTALMLFERCKTTLGPDDDRTLSAENILGTAFQRAGMLERAEKLYRGLVEKRERVSGRENVETFRASFNLAIALMTQKKSEEGLPLMERAVEGIGKQQGAESPEASMMTDSLILAYFQTEKFDRAIPLLEKIVERQRKTLPPNHPATLERMEFLVQAYCSAGHPAKAVPLAEGLVQAAEMDKGLANPRTAMAIEILATTYRAAGRPRDAIAVRERLHKAVEKAGGPNNPNTLVALENVADEYLAAARISDAILALERAHAGWVKARGPNDADALSCLNRLGVAYWQNRQFDQSIRLYEGLVEAHRKLHGETDPETLNAMTNLAANYRGGGREPESIALLEKICRVAKDASILRFARQELMDAYEQVGRVAEARALAKEHIAAISKSQAPDRAADLARAGSTLLRLKAWADAESVLREALSALEKVKPGAWKTFSTKSMLGEVLLAQKNYIESEQLLLAGYTGLTKTADTIPPAIRSLLPDAVDRIIEFYTATNKPDELRKWRAERAKYPPQQAPAPREKR
jgi:eukaryotic-like serine/threonine-protein kinase